MREKRPRRIISAPNASASVFRIERRQIIEFAKAGQFITASLVGSTLLHPSCTLAA